MTKKVEVNVPEDKNRLPIMHPEAHERYVTPLVDVYETPDAFVLLIDMPGATKESIGLSLDRGSLIVKAAIGARHREDKHMLINELRATGYYRVFNLSDGIERNAIDARFDQGVLTVKMGKSDAMKPREIRIY
jgi:HSP20 family protein